MKKNNVQIKKINDKLKKIDNKIKKIDNKFENEKFNKNETKSENFKFLIFDRN